VQNVIAVRKASGRFTSFEEFCTRVDLRIVNRKVRNASRSAVHSILWASPGPRFSRPSNTDESCGDGSARSRTRSGGAVRRGAGERAAKAMGQRPAVEWAQGEMLAFEKELLGFYVTGHPLSEYAEILKRYELTSSGKLAQLQDGQVARIGGSSANWCRRRRSRASRWRS